MSKTLLRPVSFSGSVAICSYGVYQCKAQHYACKKGNINKEIWSIDTKRCSVRCGDRESNPPRCYYVGWKFPPHIGSSGEMRGHWVYMLIPSDVWASSRFGIYFWIPFTGLRSNLGKDRGRVSGITRTIIIMHNFNLISGPTTMLHFFVCIHMIAVIVIF